MTSPVTDHRARSSQPHIHTLSCTEHNCHLPVGRITSNSLVIMARHHGEKHYAEIPLVEVLRLISANIDTNTLTPRVETVTRCVEGCNPT